MEKVRRRISVTPDSPLAHLIRVAASSGGRVEVDTGEAAYQVDVRPVSTLRDRRLRQLAHHLAGSLANVDFLGWESSEAAERWVDELRKADAYPLDQDAPTGL
jgi:hypothetical protein